MLAYATSILAIPCSLLMFITVPGSVLESVSPGATSVHGIPICNDARWSVGINIPDARDVASGEIRAVEAILDINRAHIGYRYTLNDGRTYVSDRSRNMLTLSGLAAMNELVNAMSSFSYNAFDPRDNGYMVYAVKWNKATADRLQLTVAPCLMPKT